MRSVLANLQDHAWKAYAELWQSSGLGLGGCCPASGFYPTVALGKLLQLLHFMFLSCAIRCLTMHCLSAFHHSKDLSFHLIGLF